MTTLNDITVRALAMKKADGIRYIAKALKDEQENAHALEERGAGGRRHMTVARMASIYSHQSYSGKLGNVSRETLLNIRR